jgi:hypothetical protein
MRKANEDIWGMHLLFRVNLAYLREMIGTSGMDENGGIRRPATKAGTEAARPTEEGASARCSRRSRRRISFGAESL